MPETMNGAEQMRIALAEEVRKSKEELSFASPDAFREIMTRYRAVLEGKGKNVSGLTNEDLIEQMAYLNAENDMLN